MLLLCSLSFNLSHYSSMLQGQCTQTLYSWSSSKQQPMCLLQGSSRSSRCYWLYSSIQGIVRRGERFSNYYTYRIKGTTRGKHVRRGKRLTYNYTKGTTGGEHVPERNTPANMNPPNIWWATYSGWGYESARATCWGWRVESVRHFNFWPKQKQLTIVCTYMHHLF